MIEEITERLYIGDQDACFDWAKKKKGAILHACKEPCHRQAVGYTGRALDKGHPEYLVSHRKTDHLYLNLVDVENPDFFSVEMLSEALFFLTVRLFEGKSVLIHCNKGESRAPSLALLYLYTHHIPRESPLSYTFDYALREFRTRYPLYAPASGILEHIRQNWLEYMEIGRIVTL